MSFGALKSRLPCLRISSYSRQIFQKRQATMAVLGIETSCDDTGAAVIDGSTNAVLGEALHQQTRAHMLHGGIRPATAKSLHAEHIHSVVTTAMQRAGLDFSELSAVATTVKPGLQLSLGVGTGYGKQIALDHRLPFIPIHHMEAHTLTVRLMQQVEFPFLCLLASGGHCLLVICRGIDDFSVLGSSLDDAPGEAFDKAARYLNLRMLRDYIDMSGGAAIEHLAKDGDPKAFNVSGQSAPMSRYRDCNFSFSGLKYNMESFIKRLEKEHDLDGDTPLPLPLLRDLSASFQHSVCEHIVRRTHRAMLYYNSVIPDQPHNVLVVSGGVASNAALRNWLDKVCTTLGGWSLVCPPPELCTDNGVMIAWNGVERLRAGKGVLTDPDDIRAVDYTGKCPLGEDLSREVGLQGIKVSKWVKA